MSEFDIAVIGTGPGGYVCAIRAAQLGARVAAVEADSLGGACLNHGCIPTKALISSGRAAALARRLGDFGVRVSDVEVDYAAMAQRKDRVVTGLRKGVEALLQSRGIEIVRGRGRLARPGEVEVALADGTSRTLKAAKTVVATGSTPAVPDVFNVDGEKILTSRDALALTSLGSSVLIIGGGYIGCEYASLYANLGLKVTVLELLETILTGQDEDVIKEVGRGLKRRKITVRTGVKVESLGGHAAEVRAILEGGAAVTADFALVAVGRVPATSGIGLEEAGITMERGFVAVDENCRTSIESVYAIGDITGEMQLAHVASAQGVVAAEHAMGMDSRMDYRVVPACIFTDPEVAAVGITEDRARRDGIKYSVGRFQFRYLGRARAEDEAEGFVKIIGDAEKKTVLGAHVVGAAASQLVAELALAMKTGATVDELIDTIHAHPTYPEAVKEAAEDLEGRAIHVVRAK